MAAVQHDKAFLGGSNIAQRGLRVLEELENDAVLSDLWRYWQGKRGERHMPRRKDIDPLDIPRLLPHLQLIERMDEKRFRFRLTGTAIEDVYGYDMTGKFVDEVFPPARRIIAEQHYALVYERRRPIFIRNRYTNIRTVEFVATRLILPLSENDESVSMLLMGQTFAASSNYEIELGQDSAIDPDVDDIQVL